MDTCKRWTNLYATKTVEAAVCLLDHVSNFGIPNQIITDNGTQYMNKVFTHFFRFIGTESIVSIPYSKEENAIVERANKEVNRHLEALCYQRE